MSVTLTRSGLTNSEVDMAKSAIFGSRRPEFDAFVYASIGEERNGMLLSVLSALARLDVDPWDEAAELTKMSPGAASQRLTSLIGSLPDKPSTLPEPLTIANRLVALLPRGAPLFVGPDPATIRVGAAPTARDRYLVLAISLLVMGALFCAQWSLVNSGVSKPSDSGNVASSAAAVVKTPPAKTPLDDGSTRSVRRERP
jgi:hypothetical protein